MLTLFKASGIIAGANIATVLYTIDAKSVKSKNIAWFIAGFVTGITVIASIDLIKKDQNKL
jgi:hypothetical protein